jgi:hypothetical protein
MLSAHPQLSGVFMGSTEEGHKHFNIVGDKPEAWLRQPSART